MIRGSATGLGPSGASAVMSCTRRCLIASPLLGVEGEDGSDT